MVINRLSLLLVIAGLASSISQLEGQSARPQFGMGAGMGFPAGKFHSSLSGEGFGSGLQGMAFALFKIRPIPTWLRLEANYGLHGANDALKSDLSRATGVSSSEHVNLLGANLDLIYPSPTGRRAKLYALGGAGVYRATVSVTTNGGSRASGEFKVAWNVGGGLLIPLPSLSLFLETRFLRVAAPYGLPRMTVIPVVLGMRFGRNYQRAARPPRPRPQRATPVAPTPKVPPPAPTDSTRSETLYPWVGSMQNHVFYRATCDAAKGIPTNDRVSFGSEEAALGMGFKRSDAPGC